MRLRVLALLGLSLAAAGGAAYMTVAWLPSEPQNQANAKPPEPVERPSARVLVADGEIPAGTIISDGHLRWQVWPEDGVAGYIVEGGPVARDSLLGAVARDGLIDGEPITERRVVRPGDRGFLAAMLTEDHRAMSVPVNAHSGLSGLVSPGDRVDVLLTHGVRDQDGGDRQASETVLSDIRVLAMDQTTDGAEAARQIAKTATLEVTPKQAEKLSLARRLGELSLSLRPVARKGDDAVASRRSYTTDREVSAIVTGDARSGNAVVVVRGSSDAQSVPVGE